VRFIFARERDGQIHFGKRHPDVTVREVKEVFESRMVVRQTYGGAWKGIGYTRSRRFLVVVFKRGRQRDRMFILTAYPAGRKHVEVYLKVTRELP
jgi:hypothetical protein